MNKKNNKNNIKKWLNYKFDNYISKGFRAQFVLLFVAILLIVLFCGVIAGIISSDFSIGSGIWQSLMHILDQGTLGGDDTGDVAYIIVMIIVTFLGMAFTGTIVGIINNAMTEKLDDLRKGHSQIIEEEHVVIIGFDDNIHTILSEIAESNENWTGNRTVVVIDNEPKEEMEFIVKEHLRSQQEVSDNGFLKKTKKNKTNIIYRSGNVISENTFAIASVEKARSIIINKEDDFDVVRVLLALVSYLKKNGAYIDGSNPMPSIVTMMHEKENVSAAAIAAGVYHEKDDKTKTVEAENKVCILYFENILAHIFAQVCRQPGLSWVVSEIFDYENEEIYIEDVAKDGSKLEKIFEGKTFAELSDMLVNGTAIGIQKATNDGISSKICINPDPNKTKFEKGDKLIHIATDDNCLEIDKEGKKELIGEAKPYSLKENKIYHFLILGWSIPLPDVIDDIDKYAATGSTVKILSRHQDEEEITLNCPMQPKKNKRRKKELGTTEYLRIEQEIMDPYDWTLVKEYLDKCDSGEAQMPTNIVIMCQDGLDPIEADEKAAVLLLNVREYLRRHDLEDKINITTEMNLPEDQMLLSQTTVNDFIVGSEIANRMMVQVANNPYIFKVFDELLNDEGSEIYLRPFDEYVNTDKPFNFNLVQHTAKNRVLVKENGQEVVIGWIRLAKDGDKQIVKLNPSAEERNKPFALFDEKDYIDNYRVVVIAM